MICLVRNFKLISSFLQSWGKNAFLLPSSYVQQYVFSSGGVVIYAVELEYLLALYLSSVEMSKGCIFTGNIYMYFCLLAKRL